MMRNPAPLLCLARLARGVAVTFGLAGVAGVTGVAALGLASGCGASSDGSPSADVTPDAAAAVPDAYVPDPTPVTDAGPSLRTGNVDRRGRAAIAAMLLHGDDVARDAYERESTYQAWPLVTKYDALFERNLEALDALDGRKDWNTDGGGVHPLRAALLTDVLVVDTSITCSAANGFCESGYLEIERERLLGAPPHATCGGRTPNDDVMDRTLTLLVAGPGALATTDGGAGAVRRVSDGVGAATRPAARAFPYLAPPN